METQGKWEVGQDGYIYAPWGSDGSTIRICRIDTTNAKANAKRIVKCVNGWDDLIKIKERAFEAICTGDQRAEDKAIGLIEDFDKKTDVERKD